MENKILTIIEGKVDKDRWSQLRKEYDEVSKENLPSSVLTAHLIQDNGDPEIWRIVTVWKNLNAINEYRKSVETPIWIQLFKNVGVEPKLVINEVKATK